MILAELYDSFYTNTGFSTLRACVRGLVFKDGKCALVHIKCVDGFGNRDHFEIPGGGIEANESQEQALAREILEELGQIVVIRYKIGTIIDRWNLLERINIHHFYVCDFVSQHETQLTDYEKTVMSGVVWHTLEEWEMILDEPLEGINEMIHTRERIVVREALRVSKKKLE